MKFLDNLMDLVRGDADKKPHFDRLLEAARGKLNEPAKSHELAALISQEPPVLAHPVSQMCTATQFDEPVYAEWCAAMKTPKHLHRKQWEFVFILQSLRYHGALREGARGLGFGVGKEPLPAVFASLGCGIVATDLAADDRRARAWHCSGQHVSELTSLRHPSICPDAILQERVRFREVDMTRIDSDLRDFDFCWSSCAYEHLGSIAAGLDFVESSLECLKPGGLAVHTTELNLTSNTRTMDRTSTVLFRRRDFEDLALRLSKRGHEVQKFKFDPGDQPLDRHVDVAPFADNDHLKLALQNYVSTSFGIIVRKAA